MRPLTRFLRILLATAMGLSWAALAGLPAAAEVTGWGVQRPSSGAAIDRPTDLVVYVDRTATTEEEDVEVRTRLRDAAGERVSDKVLTLELQRQVENDTGDQLLFGGIIDPYELAWLVEPGVAPNGEYVLQLQLHTVTGDVERTTDWSDHPLVLDAPPAPPGQAQVEVADAAAKRMRVTWEASDTPDLLHYSVERRVDGGPWTMAEDLVAPDTTTITDTVAEFGSYRYRVSAVRPAGEPEDGQEYRSVTGDASVTTEMEAPREPAQRGGNGGGDDRTGSGGTSSAPRVSAPEPRSQEGFSAPSDANQTYEGPLDYGVEPTEVTERVPVEVARGGTSEDGGVLRVLDRSIDQERVLPAVAGGLIFLLSAAHVLRYLNE